MSASWWVLWVAVLFLVVVPLLSYSWLNRGWGPPHPSFISRHHLRHAGPHVAPAGVTRGAWRLSPDILWLLAFLLVFWVSFALWHMTRF